MKRLNLFITIWLSILTVWLSVISFAGHNSKSKPVMGMEMPVCQVQGYLYYTRFPKEKSTVSQLNKDYVYYGNIENYIDSSDSEENKDLDLTSRGRTYYNREVYFNKDNSDYIFIRIEPDKYQLLYHEEHDEKEIYDFINSFK